MRISLSGLPFAATMRMIHRIHHDPSDVRPFSHPSRTTGLAHRNVFVIEIPNLSHGRHARPQNPAHLTRNQTDLNVLTFPAHHLTRRTGTPRHLSALPRPEFNAMNDRTKRHQRQRKRIARANVRAGTGLNRISDRQADGRQDISLIPICIRDQCDTSRTIGIILHPDDFARHPDFIPLEIDNAVQTLMPAATKSRRNPPEIVSPAGARQRRSQAFFRLLFRQRLVLDSRHAAAARRRWTIRFSRHNVRTPFAPAQSTQQATPFCRQHAQKCRPARPQVRWHAERT